jgi:hypothetical protein
MFGRFVPAARAQPSPDEAAAAPAARPKKLRRETGTTLAGPGPDASGIVRSVDIAEVEASGIRWFGAGMSLLPPRTGFDRKPTLS